MQHKFVLLIIKFIIYCNDFINAQPLLGENVINVRNNEFAYVVCIVGTNNLLTVEENVRCTGTLLSKYHVLTSEHCFDILQIFPFRVLAGSHILQDCDPYYPIWIITYDQWALMDNLLIISENDIALIKIIESVPDRLGFPIVPLDAVGDLVGANVALVAWGIQGTSGSAIMETVNVTIISQYTCTNRVSILLNEFWEVPSIFFCSHAEPYALLRDGDSGGPLLFGNMIVGINKATCPKTDNEIYSQKLNIHVRIDNYIQFINENVSY